MQKIKNYEVAWVDEYQLCGGTKKCMVKMPGNARVLSLFLSNDILYVSALVSADAQDEVERWFFVYRSETVFNGRGLSFIGTFIMGELIFYLFEDTWGLE